MEPCPYCNQSNFSESYMQDTVFNGKTFSYLTCKSCGVISVHPFPAESDYLAMYPPEYQGEIHTSGNMIYGDLISKINEFVHKGARILDYGCGNSQLVCELHEAGFSVSAVEYNPAFVDLLRKKINFCNFFTTDEFWNDQSLKYDVIIFNNVIEHLTNPLEIIGRIKARLSSQGIVVAMGPVENNFSLAHQLRKLIFQLRRKTSDGQSHHAPFHITFTHAANQESLFLRLGFHTRFFSISEQPWPFPSTLSWKKPAKAVLYLIAKISIILSPFLHKKAGNMFVYVGLNQPQL